MTHDLEKALLAQFEKGQCTEGVWQSRVDAVTAMLGQDFSRRQVQRLLAELLRDGCLERSFETIWMLRLTQQGWHRRSDLTCYMDKIEFHGPRDRNPTDPGRSIWYDVLVNGVDWGSVHASDAADIERRYHNIRHSLCLSRRSNREIIRAIRAHFATDPRTS